MDFKTNKMIKKLCLTALLALSAGGAWAQQVLDIPFREGEYWWGGAVAQGSNMPYTRAMEAFDLERRVDNNLTAPLLVSSDGRYVWSEKPFAFSVSESGLRLQSRYDSLTVEQGGRTLREAFLAAGSRHFAPDGQIPPELFFAKPQYNTWIELMYDQNQQDILAYARAILANGLPAGILMIDDNWQRRYGNFDFRTEAFPDARGMVDELHRMGFRVMVWISPFVSPDSPEFRELREKGYLVEDKSGRPAIIRWWNGYSASYDLTNPEAVAHLSARLKEMQRKYGVDGFKCDAGDPDFYRSDRQSYHDSAAVSTDHTQAWAEFALGFPFHEMRAGWKTGGHPVVQRLGDKNCSWRALQSLIPQMVATGLMGYPYACPDMIGGGQIESFRHADLSRIDQELVVRSAQVHALMPMMQFSVAPWRILSPDKLEMVKAAAALHQRFAPYILDCARRASQTGDPIVRHMEYEFPHEGMAGCKDQYMLGDKYLVAPMVTKGRSRTVKLPKGRWRDDTGKNWRGGREVTIDVPLGRLPYFERLK